MYKNECRLLRCPSAAQLATCLGVFVCVHMHGSMNKVRYLARVWVCCYVCRYLAVQLASCLYTCVYVYVCMYVCMCVCVCLCVYVHVHMYTHNTYSFPLHTHVYIHTQYIHIHNTRTHILSLSSCSATFRREKNCFRFNSLRFPPHSFSTFILKKKMGGKWTCFPFSSLHFVHASPHFTNLFQVLPLYMV